MKNGHLDEVIQPLTIEQDSKKMENKERVTNAPSVLTEDSQEEVLHRVVGTPKLVVQPLGLRLGVHVSSVQLQELNVRYKTSLPIPSWALLWGVTHQHISLNSRFDGSNCQDLTSKVSLVRVSCTKSILCDVDDKN